MLLLHEIYKKNNNLLLIIAWNQVSESG